MGCSDLEAKSIVSRVQTNFYTFDTLIDFYNSTFITYKGFHDFINDNEIKAKKKRKWIHQVNYASVLLYDDDFIVNHSLKIYPPVLRIFQGSEQRRKNSSTSSDITTTPRTNRVKNTFTESNFSEVDIKQDHKKEDFFKNKVLLTKSSLQGSFKDIPFTSQSSSCEEIKNIQSEKSTPDFIKFK